MQSSVIPLVNFPQIDVPQPTVPWANALQSAMKTYGNVQDLQGQYYKNLIDQAKSQYAKPMAYAELQKAQAEPDLIKAQTVYQQALAKGMPSEVALRIAQASAIPSEIDLRKSETTKQDILNSNLQEREKAEIEEAKARAKYYSQGASRGGVANAAEQAFQSNVLADNPQIVDPDKQRELINVVSSGGTHLADGTPVNPMSEITKRSYDRALKTTTTTQGINQNLQANQASAEAPIYRKYINQGVVDTGYGTTIFGTSIKQIKDSLDIHNPAAQKRLGQYLAAQQLTYDLAALNLKINALPPGVRLATEIKKLSAQSVDARFPTQSAESRRIASEIVAQALEEGLKARNKFGISVSSAFKGNNQQQSSDSGWDPSKLSDDALRIIANG